MMNKIVCTKCGQIYDPGLQNCPNCGASASRAPERAPAAANASDKALRREEEQLLRREEQRSKKLRKERSRAETAAGKIPAAFLWISAVLLCLAILVGVLYLLWGNGLVHLTVFDKLSGRNAAPVETEATSAPTEKPAETAEPAPATTAAPETEAPETELPATETPVTEAPATEPPATELPTEEPVTEVPTELPTEEPPTEAPTEPKIELPFTFDLSDTQYVLVNSEHPLPADFEASAGDLYTTDNRVTVRKLIIADLDEMIKACRKAQSDNGGYIKPIKGLDSAAAATDEYITGLAVDIFYAGASQSYDVEKNRDSETLKWLAEHSWEYGFLLRFPEDKEAITGVSYQPWHFRFVGRDAAAYAHENNLCLEELIAVMESAQ